MSLIQSQGQVADSQREVSPGLTANLPSNNPFRNRAVSPANSIPSPVTTTFNIPSTGPERPTSRNPFLDQTEKKDAATVKVKSTSPERGASSMAGRSSPKKPALRGHAVELFDNLSLNDGPLANGPRQPGPPPYSARPPRPENMPPRSRNAPLGHHPSRSQEDEKQRLRNGGAPHGQPQELDIFADPPENARPRRPARRNSDSSVASKLLSQEDLERRRRRKEREARYRAEGKARAPTSKSKKPNKQLDIIDSLDVTSIYGTGLFHHDGPFDACNPHRNRKGSQRAPMQAFAKDSANNVIGGSGPINKNINFDQIHGRGAEGFTDYSTSGAANPLVEPVSFEPYAGSSAPVRTGPGVRPGIDRTSSFNPTARVEPVHGEESMGLGTSTFLEGAPAARAAIKRRESETDQIPGMGNTGGLGRKRSLAQKIRGIGNANRTAGPGPSGRITSPEGTYERRISPTSPGDRTLKMKETNPFFNDYDDAYERKGARIQIAEGRNRTGSIGGGEDQINVRARAMSSPKRAVTGGILERRQTSDVPIDGPGDSSGGGGFLNRVKSLKGGKRTRPER